MNKRVLYYVKKTIKEKFDKRLKIDIMPRAKYLKLGDTMEIEYKIKVEYDKEL